ncbi:UNVERIFIED_CONTAM: hypothetical protein Sangu_1184700 [Sesamum angustifolium]|uniref:Uncharacterized protein n=1 Tax=Sesamum angustifolium TaxID=2727405 RepID=A0AAW2NI51_9LAMI
MHLVRYLTGCPDSGLFFPVSNSFTLTAYCDADWASCVDTRRSLIGYCVFLGYALIAWKTKKQPTVVRSTADAKYRSLGAIVSALHIMANPVFHERTKHLEIDCHVVRDKYKSGCVFPSHISGRLQLVDLFTKLPSLFYFCHILVQDRFDFCHPSPS